MSEALVQRVARGVDNIRRCVEIRFSNLKMDDIATLCLQRSCLDQNFESGLGAETRHPLRQAKFAGLSHDAVISLIKALAQLVFLSTSQLEPCAIREFAADTPNLSRASSRCYSVVL